MSGKYGFGGGIELPTPKVQPKSKGGADKEVIEQAVQVGGALGFVNREPATRLKPGPKRKEPQDKVSIPGPKRVIEEFRGFCRLHDLTLWQGLERLLSSQPGREGD